MAYIFLDLDETLIRKENASAVQSRREVVARIASEPNPSPMKLKMADNARRDLGFYEKAHPISFGNDQLIIMFRPHLKECLQALKHVGSVCLLTSAQQDYAERILQMGGVTNLFDEIYSTRGVVPQVADTHPWILVDDMESAFGWKLRDLGGILGDTFNNEEVRRKLDQYAEKHYVAIKSFQGDPNDNELLSLPTRIQAKLSQQ